MRDVCQRVGKQGGRKGSRGERRRGEEATEMRAHAQVRVEGQNHVFDRLQTIALEGKELIELLHLLKAEFFQLAHTAMHPE